MILPDPVPRALEFFLGIAGGSQLHSSSINVIDVAQRLTVFVDIEPVPTDRRKVEWVERGIARSFILLYPIEGLLLPLKVLVSRNCPETVLSSTTVRLRERQNNND